MYPGMSSKLRSLYRSEASGRTEFSQIFRRHLADKFVCLMNTLVGSNDKVFTMTEKLISASTVFWCKAGVCRMRT
jgi:hypothetical protein